MQKISKFKYLELAIGASLYKHRDFIKFLFSIPKDKNDYIYIGNNSYYVNVNGQTYEINDAPVNMPLYIPPDKIKVTKGTLSIIKEDITTTVGRLILNAVLIEYGLNGKLDYNNTTKWDLDSYVKSNLGDSLTIQDYIRLAKAAAFLRTLSNGIVIPAIPEIVKPPKELFKKRKEVINSMIKKYGKDDFYNNPLRVVEYEKIMMDWIQDHYKDNSVFKILFKGKIATSFKKKYITLGIPNTLTPQDKKVFISNSLNDGYPKDKEQLAAINNGTRYGSAARGLETQESGTIANRLAIATHSYKIIEEDCGTKDTYQFYVTKDSFSSLEYVNIIDNNKVVTITADNFDKYIGKVVNVRLPYYCKSKGDNLCKTCSGKLLSKFENGVGILAIGLGGSGLKNSLSKFHVVDNKLEEITYKDIFGV